MFLLFGIGILLWAIVPVWDKKTAKGKQEQVTYLRRNFCDYIHNRFYHSWFHFGLGDRYENYNKKYFFITVLFLILIQNFYYAQSEDQCFKCHLDMDDAKASLYKTDIHHLKGISCSGCHGGDATSDDMDIAMSKEKGFIGVPSKVKRYEVCVNCHANEQKNEKFWFKDSHRSI